MYETCPIYNFLGWSHSILTFKNHVSNKRLPKPKKWRIQKKRSYLIKAHNWLIWMYVCGRIPAVNIGRWVIRNSCWVLYVQRNGYQCHESSILMILPTEKGFWVSMIEMWKFTKVHCLTKKIIHTSDTTYSSRRTVVLWVYCSRWWCQIVTSICCTIYLNTCYMIWVLDSIWFKYLSRYSHLFSKLVAQFFYERYSRMLYVPPKTGVCLYLMRYTH